MKHVQLQEKEAAVPILPAMTAMSPAPLQPEITPLAPDGLATTIAYEHFFAEIKAPAETDQPYCFYIGHPEGKLLSHPILLDDKKLLTIGRNTESDIHLPDDEVSFNHACLSSTFMFIWSDHTPSKQLSSKGNSSALHA